MNLSLDESVALAKAVGSSIRDVNDVEVLVAPPFVWLTVVKEVIGEGRVLLAAQNMHWEPSGAFTGEVSGAMLKEAGCTHVILGHSERRSLFQESSEMIDRKVQAACGLGMIPIVCIGETLEERESGKTFDVLKTQLELSLQGMVKEGKIPHATTLAYEPVWAIGTGKTASPDQAQEAHQFVREWVESRFDSDTAQAVRILYGGSVKPGNAAELMGQPDIDGALVGGASLKADSFAGIIHFRHA
jgi:triosephosphate isomerase